MDRQSVGQVTPEVFVFGSREKPLFVVGDYKQSIYSFQGADPAIFGRMRDDFRAFRIDRIASVVIAGRIFKPERGKQLADLVLLTLDADAFFARFGFAPVDRERVPETVRASREFTIHHCDRAVCMRVLL